MKTIILSTCTLILATGMMLLSGCGGDQQSVSFSPRPAEVFFTYPLPEQTDVSVHTLMVIRLSDTVTNGDALDDQVISLKGPDHDVALEISLTEELDGRSIVLRPEQPLRPATEYQLSIGSIDTLGGEMTFPEGGFSFTTRGANGGPRSLRISDEGFALRRMIPDGNDLEVIDFSALRFQFSHPLDPETVRYGDTISLVDADDQLVGATLISKGPYVTLDPHENLVPGARYTLTLSDQLASLYGDSISAPFDGDFETSFVPRASGPTERMALQVPDDGTRSPLTGEIANLVPVVATLLGDETRSQQGGDLFTELAFVPNFPDATPIRVPKGTQLTGDQLVVELGGEIPAGFNSGDLVVEMISDASGYLLPNPYSNAEDAPRQLRMFMDIAITTGDARANAAFTQDVLHLEVIGQAIVEDGVLIGDGITIVETDLLGLETAFGTLSFRMEAYRDQLSAPQPVADTTPPLLQSWAPGDEIAFTDNSELHRPGNPIVMTSTRALDRTTLADNMALFADGMEVSDFSVRQDGATVSIDTDLQYGVSYELDLLPGITDLHGNALTPRTLSFSMPDYTAGPAASPLALTTYPGFPCATNNRDIANGHHGRCVGGRETDDHLPVSSIPADRSISVSFSQIMNEESFTGSGFRVERVNSDGSVIEAIEGELEIKPRQVRFTPHTPWQEGELYRYTLASNGSHRNNHCDVSSMICSADGLPLRTRTLAQSADQAPTLDGGGPDLEIYFHGREATRSVFTHLDGLPTADVNSNTIRDPDEQSALANPGLLRNSARLFVANTTGSISDGQVGCEPGEQCPEQEYAYLTGAFDGDMLGYLSPSEAAEVARAPLPPEVAANGGILVYLYPTAIQTSNIVVYGEVSIPGVSADPADTGPLTMRLRYLCDARSNAAAPSPDHSEALPQCSEGESGLPEGWIIEGPEGTPEFVGNLNTYLDAPALDPKLRIDGVDDFLDAIGGPVCTIPLLCDVLPGGSPSAGDTIPVSHNQYSFGLSAAIRGPITFMEDGRLQISQVNLAPIDADVELVAAGLLDSVVTLRIDSGEINLNFTSQFPKR